MHRTQRGSPGASGFGSRRLLRIRIARVRLSRSRFSSEARAWARPPLHLWKLATVAIFSALRVGRSVRCGRPAHEAPLPLSSLATAAADSSWCRPETVPLGKRCRSSVWSAGSTVAGRRPYARRPQGQPACTTQSP